jgi:hypothetical protein
MKLDRKISALMLLTALLALGPIAPNAALAKNAPPASAAQTSTRRASDAAALAEILAYRNLDLNEALQGMVRTLPAEVATQLERILNGVYVVDYKNTAPELLKAFNGQIALADMKFPFLYDKANDPYYQKVVAGRDILLNSSGPLTVDLLKNLHRQAVGYDANGSSEPGGTIRMRHVYGPEFEVGLPDDVIKTINANPYLHYEPGLSIYADQVKSPEQARIGDRTRGVTVYPRLIDVKDAALDRIRASNPELIAKIVDYRSRHSGSTRDRNASLTQELITALLTERITTFEKDALALGPIRTSADIQRYIQLITQFQRDYVSIHPFADGNGRTSRLVLNYLAHRQHLPMVRFIDPNEDDESSLEKWTSLVQEGMHSTALLEQDFLRRISLNQPVESSVALFTPALPPIRYSSDELDRFKAFINTELQKSPQRLSDFAKNPVQTMRQLRDAFLAE